MNLFIIGVFLLVLLVVLWTILSNKGRKTNRKIDTKFINGRYDIDRRGIVDRKRK